MEEPQNDFGHGKCRGRSHPELQTVIDDAKAECEKVVEENTQLKQKIAILEQAGGNQSELLSENSRLKDAAVLADKALKDAEAQVVGIKLNFKLLKRYSCNAGTYC